MPEVNILIAFGAGLLSFISPCVLPLYPAFLSYITGMSVEEINTNQKTFNKKALIHTIAFLIGFSLVFIVIGFSTNYIAEFLVRNNVLIRQLGAVLIIFFGLVIIGVFNFEFLMKDKRVSFKNRLSCFIGLLLI